MKQPFHLSRAVRIAKYSLLKIRTGRVARVLIGAAVVVGLYLVLAGLSSLGSPRTVSGRLDRGTAPLSGLKTLTAPRLGPLLSLPDVHAQSLCSDSTLNGWYGGYSFSSTGQPVVAYYFEGNGSLDGGTYESSNSSGVSGGGTFTGTYSMSGNCTGTMSISTGGNI